MTQDTQVKQCHHHGFTVKDVDRSVRFYQEAFDLELVRVSERSNLPSYDRMLGYENVRLRVGILRHPQTGFVLELVEYCHPRGESRELANHFVGAAHLAFEVGDVDAVHERLVAAGGGQISPPTDIVRDGKRVARGLYALDPDGISVEVFQEFEDVVKQ